MQVHGVIKSIGSTQQVTDNFSKRELVLEIERTSQYPQTVLFELNNAKTSLLDKYTEGQEVSVDFNLRGRQWTNPQGEVKTFNTLQAWKIETVNGTQSPAPSTQPQNTPPPPAEDNGNVNTEDLPF